MLQKSVAIIIPVKHFNERLEKCLRKCLELDYSNFEILVFPDVGFDGIKDKKIRIIPTGSIGPAIKRDMALVNSKAEIFAFIDDDAYPALDWLKNAVTYFKDKEVAAVCGPSVTPNESNLAAYASGYIFSSILATGKYAYRYVPTKCREVDDYPSCNFIILRDIFEQVGGFNSAFFPGEDTKLCLDITKKLGKKIIYAPSVLVYHHRRELWRPHLNQVANYAIHRGYFAKRYPETSLRFVYFVPALFLIYLIVSAVASVWNKIIAAIYLSSILVYLCLLFSYSIFTLFKEGRGKAFIFKLQLVFLVTVGIVLTHFYYGAFFIRGILSRRLKEENK